LASLITLPLLWKTWENLKWGLNVELLKSMLRYSLPLVVVGLAGMINETLDRVLLKELLPADLGDAEAGMYSAFYKLSLVLTLFVQAFRFAAEPFFFGKSNDKDAPETYALVMRYFVYVSCGIFLATMICIPWLAPLLLQKPLYYENARGLKIVPVLLMANLCLGIYYNLSIWYKLSGKTQMGGLIALFGAIVTIFGNFLFIPKFGFVASAYTTLSAYATLVVLGYWFGQKYYPIPYQLGIIFLILTLAVVPIVVLPTMFPMIHHAYYWALLPLYLAVVFAIEKRLSRTPLNQS
jgi:O-antigen/teichoic acid export membrane protein